MLNQHNSCLNNSLLLKPQSVLSAYCQLPNCSESYDFHGRHLLANYTGCHIDALTNHKGLIEVMIEAVKLTGAHLLNYIVHEFQPHGIAVVMLLSESHATIHTYPEHLSCFLDIFTCGDCHVEHFDNAITQYLKPNAGERKIITRNQRFITDKPNPFQKDKE